MTKPSNILPDTPAYDLRAHLAYVKELHRDYPWNTKEKCEEHLFQCVAFLQVPEALQLPFAHLIWALFTAEDIYCPDVPTNESRHYLEHLQEVFTSKDFITRAERQLQMFTATYVESLPNYVRELETFDAP